MSVTATTPSLGARRVPGRVTRSRCGSPPAATVALLESEHFTYKVASDSGADALILASEDYTGVNPRYPAGTAGQVRRRVRRRPRRQRHQPRQGRRRPGCPAPLGVLSHFDAVVWETGDDRLVCNTPRTRFHRHVPVRPRPRHRRRRAPAVPDDRLARLPQRGRQARPGRGEHAVLRPARPVAHAVSSTGSLERRTCDCVITCDFLTDCLLLSDDFAQYYLEATHQRSPSSGRPASTAKASWTACRGGVRRAGRGRQPAQRGRGVLPDQRRAPGRGLPAVCRGGDQHVPRAATANPSARSKDPARPAPSRRRCRTSGSAARSISPASRPPGRPPCG